MIAVDLITICVTLLCLEIKSDTKNTALHQKHIFPNEAFDLLL